MKVLKHLPNFLTLSNAVSGSIGIIFIFDGRLDLASYMVWVAAGFDFLDGFAARLVKVSSDLGKELDSMADMVSFGALPGFFMFHLIKQATDEPLLPYLGLLIIALSALRLAKFNIDTRQSDIFIGLPTPANALFITSLPALASLGLFESWVLSSTSLVCISLAFSYLLVAELPLLSLKFKNFSWKDNKDRYLLILLSVILLMVWKLNAISLVILGYLLFSVVMNLFGSNNVTSKQ